MIDRLDYGKINELVRSKAGTIFGRLITRIEGLDDYVYRYDAGNSFFAFIGL